MTACRRGDVLLVPCSSIDTVADMGALRRYNGDAMAVGRLAGTSLRRGRGVTRRTYRVEVVVHRWDEGGYVAEAPALQGCWVVAESVAAAIGDWTAHGYSSSCR